MECFFKLTQQRGEVEHLTTVAQLLALFVPRHLDILSGVEASGEVTTTVRVGSPKSGAHLTLPTNCLGILLGFLR